MLRSTLAAFVPLFGWPVVVKVPGGCDDRSDVRDALVAGVRAARGLAWLVRFCCRHDIAAAGDRRLSGARLLGRWTGLHLAGLDPADRDRPDASPHTSQPGGPLERQSRQAERHRPEIQPRRAARRPPGCRSSSRSDGRLTRSERGTGFNSTSHATVSRRLRHCSSRAGNGARHARRKTVCGLHAPVGAQSSAFAGPGTGRSSPRRSRPCWVPASPRQPIGLPRPAAISISR